MNTLDALKACDCMCLGLKIKRPEAAVADPSRLNILEVFPYYITNESFLIQAKDGPT